MNDTSLKMESLLRKLVMAKSGEERLAMGCAMFDDAKVIALAGLHAERSGMDEREHRVQLLMRLYGQEFGASRSARVCARLRSA